MNKTDKLKMRVIFAKDVIAQLNANRIKAVTGTYLKLPGGLVDKIIWEKECKTTKEFQKELCNLPKTNECKACALGALFVSAVAKTNNVCPSYCFQKEDLVDKLKNFFSHTELILIESYFEGAWMGLGSCTKEQDKSIFDWLNKNGNPKDRLKKICRNIIRNRGVFKPFVK